MTTEQRVDQVENRQDRADEWLAKLTEAVLEMRRENRQTRRIWIAIARKQELFDDDEFQDVFGDE